MLHSPPPSVSPEHSVGSPELGLAGSRQPLCTWDPSSTARTLCGRGSPRA